VLMSMFGGLALAGALPGQGSGEDESGFVEIQDVETDEPVETEAPEIGDADDQGENEDADDQARTSTTTRATMTRARRRTPTTRATTTRARRTSGARPTGHIRRIDARSLREVLPTTVGG
jgi:hypothetical protein